MARPWGIYAGLLAGSLLAATAVAIWWQADEGMLSVAKAARASQDPATEVLVEGTLVPAREGPLVISPASEEGAIAFELIFYATGKDRHGAITSNRVDRYFGGLPMVIRAGDRHYRLGGEVSRIFTRDSLTLAVDSPQAWFPVRLQTAFAGRPFTVREAVLEPGETIAVRGRLDGADPDLILPISGALDVWEGGLAPFQRARDERLRWAYGAAAVGGLLMIMPWFLRRRGSRDPYAGWKVFR